MTAYSEDVEFRSFIEVATYGDKEDGFHVGKLTRFDDQTITVEEPTGRKVTLDCDKVTFGTHAILSPESLTLAYLSSRGRKLARIDLESHGVVQGYLLSGNEKTFRLINRGQPDVEFDVVDVKKLLVPN